MKLADFGSSLHVSQLGPVREVAAGSRGPYLFERGQNFEAYMCNAAIFHCDGMARYKHLRNISLIAVDHAECLQDTNNHLEFDEDGGSP